MASLHVLGALSRKWRTSPPFPNWMDYAPNFAKYKEERIGDVLRKFGLQEAQGNKEFIKKKLVESAHPGQRELNTVIALELLPIFEESAECWLP